MKSDSAIQRLLSSVPLFRDLTHEELASFLGHCRQEEVPAGCVVIEQGERGRHLFAVMSGMLGIVRKQDDAVAPIEIATVGAGEVFGELALVDYGERSASVVAREPCRLLRFDRMDVVRLQPTLLCKLYRNVGMSMANRLRQTNGTVTVLLAEKLANEDKAVEATSGGNNNFAAPEQRVVIRR
jgi:CRP-like cAMP-binding protein